MSSILRRDADPAAGTADDRTDRFQVVTLGRGDRADLFDLVDADPVVNAVVSARLHAGAELTPAGLGGRVFGLRDGIGRLRAAALDSGAVTLMGAASEQGWAALAGSLSRRGRSGGSVVGRSAAVAACWPALAPRWGAPRLVRRAQPLLVTDVRGLALQPPHPGVRPMRAEDLDAYVPAAAAMFSEELEISPLAGVSERDYRRRVLETITQGRALGIRDDRGRVVFKADLGAVSPHTCQVQGVWVHPRLRGNGVGTAAVAAVLRYALDLAPTVSLYVNDFNTPAVRLYRRLGMTQHAVLSTVLL